MSEPDIHFLANPLLTEEGFINEACLNELAAAIKQIPKVHERTNKDPEWTTPKWTNLRDITASIAYIAIRNLKEHAFPPDLEKVIGYLYACLRPKFDEHELALISLCQISVWLYELLYEPGLEIFKGWNTHEVLGDDWLDLDALIIGACVHIRDDRRVFEAFNHKFKEEHGKLSNNNNA